MALKVLSEKVLEEVLTQWKEAKENSEATTGNAFVEIVLEAFLNPKTKVEVVPTPTDEQAAEIQNLLNEIGRLKTDISLKDDRIEDLENLNAQLQTQQPGEPAEPAQIQLEENQEIITFDKPLIIKVLDIEREIASKQAKKEISRGQHLIDTFFMGIRNGNSYPYRVWSNGELQKLAKETQTPEQ